LEKHQKERLIVVAVRIRGGKVPFSINSTLASDLMVCKCGHADDLHHVIGRDEELQHDKVVCEVCGCDSDNQVGDPTL
jgi:hypothetical protein